MAGASELLKTTTLGGNPEANVAIATAMLGGMSGGMPGMGGGTEALFGAAPETSAMTKSLMQPLGSAPTPFFTEAAMSTGMGSDPNALARALSPETFSMGAPPGSASGGTDWAKLAKDSLDMMDGDSTSGRTGANGGVRPAGYNPQKSMQEQFAEIMGWLQANGGMR